MTTRTRIASIAAATAFLSTAADAATPEQIVVTGLRTEHSVLDSPAAISVITREDIEQSGALTVADLLRARAGLQVRDTIGDGGRGVVVSLRGFGENASNNTLILVDGRRLNNPSLAPPDLNTVAIGDIERIEVLQGGGGVLFGDQAVGGVINIVTRPVEARALSVEAGGGSFDANRVAMSASGRTQSGLGARLSAERRESDNYRDNNASEYANVLGQVEYSTAATRVFAEAQYTDDQLEFPGALSPQEAREDRRQSVFTGDYGDQETTTLRVGGRHAFSRAWTAEFELSEREMDGDAYQGGPQWGAPNTSEMRVRSASPRLLGTFPVAAGDALLTVGIDWTDSEYLLDIPLYAFRTDFAQEQQDAYAQLVYPLTATLQLAGGVRRSEVDDDNRGTDRQNSDGETITTATLAWQFRDGMRALLRRDEVLRYANVDENGYVEVGVDFLQPQTGASWETGLEWYGARLSGRAMLFDLELQDEILYDPSANGPDAIWGFYGANVNRDSRRRGLLAETRWQANERLSLSASYTFTEAEITSGTFDGRDVPYVSPHTGALSATWVVLPGVSLFAEYAWDGERYPLGDNANAFDEVDAEGVVNLALRWQRERWHASLRANNLFGEEYDSLTDIYGVYPAPERAAWLSVGFSL
jgi:iron complex outermembrane receptor protein